MLIIPPNTIYIAYEQIAIIAVEIIGLITKLFQFRLNLTFFFSTKNAIMNATRWQATDPIDAPYTFIAGILRSIKFNISLVTTPIPKAVAGTITFPKPCKPPLIVWFKTENIIVKAATCNSVAPLLAFGYNRFNIGPANTHIPIVQGKPISIDTNKENEVRLVAVVVSFLAFASAIAGTKAVANAIFTDTTYDVVSSTSNGLMSSDDKIKLDNMSEKLDTKSETITYTTIISTSKKPGSQKKTGILF